MSLYRCFFDDDDISLYRFTHSMWNLKIDIFQILFFKDIDQIGSLWLKGIEDNYNYTSEIQTFDPIGSALLYELEWIALTALTKKLNSVWNVTHNKIETIGNKSHLR